MQIIGITGTNGAGKGVVVEHLTSKGFVHYSARTQLETDLVAQGIAIDRSSLREKANELRKVFGADVMARRLIALGREHGDQKIVIESIRTTSEAQYLKEQGGVLVAIDADRETRFKRIQGRRSATDHLDFATFITQEEREWYGAEGTHDMNLMDVMHMADFTIQNDGSISELHRAIEEVLEIGSAPGTPAGSR